MRKIINKTVKKVTNAILAKELVSKTNDPQSYSFLSILPNPDPVLRKLGRSQEVYDAISYDAHVVGEVRSTRGKLLKHKWRISPGGDRPQDMQAFELCEKLFKTKPDTNISWDDLIWNTFQSIYKGFTCMELQWHKQGDLLVPYRISDKANRRFAFGQDNELRMLTKTNMTNGEEIPNYKILLTRHMPSADNPYGFAIFSACYWPYVFKHNGFRWYSKFLEKYGIPKAIGRYPAGTQEAEIEKLAESLQDMVEDAVAAIPEGTAVDLLEVKSTGTNMHDPHINLCNREISKAITSQTLGSEVTEAGSRSTGEVQKERQDDNGEADRSMVACTFSDLCESVTSLNFTDAMPPTFEWYEEKEVTETQVNTLETATRIVPVKRSEVYSRLQLTPPEASDDVVFRGATPEKPNSFNQCLHDHNHNFNAPDPDELSALAAQGDAKAQKAIERMVSAIEEYANDEAVSLDDLDEALPGILDNIDDSEFVDAIESTTVIANAMGLDDAK